MDLLKLEANQFARLSFDCGCGRRHGVAIRSILIGEGLVGEIGELAASYGRLIFLVADENTWAAFGQCLCEALTERGLEVRAHVFSPQGMLIPDERAAGRLLMELPKDTSLILAVGSGTINDLCRLLSARTGVPCVTAGTAPSMDGYASVISALIVDGAKVSYETASADGIAADVAVMKEAPLDMLRAGYGDILGKTVSLADWSLGREVNGEYHCEETERLVDAAMNRCVELTDKLSDRDSEAVRRVAEALILSGVAISLAGNSRPCSGCEHHLSHYWEMDAIAKGHEHPLHGNAVGAATVAMAMIYELLSDKLPASCRRPLPSAKVAELLSRTGAADSPRKLGIPRELFHESVLHAMEVRPRYTILRFASDLGLLPELADTLTRRFYDDEQ